MSGCILWINGRWVQNKGFWGLEKKDEDNLIAKAIVHLVFD
jgi:hypothetical protein